MSAWPVMYRASSEARNTAAAPMSSGSCSHFIGTMSATRFSNTCRGVMPLKAGLVSAMWAASFCQKSVQRTPGQIALTVTRCGASSLATTRVNVITPCLATLYGGIVTATSGPAMDAMLMIRDRKSTRLNSSHGYISYAVFCLKKKNHHPAHHQLPSVVLVDDLTT